MNAFLPTIPPDTALEFETHRLTLKPIVAADAEDLWNVIKDPELHLYDNFKPENFEKVKERCERWQKRLSPDGQEIWLNWIARLKTSSEPIGHFQAGIQKNGITSVGYLVGLKFQRKGFAFEALQEMLAILADPFKVTEFMASIDPANTASIELVKKLGFHLFTDPNLELPSNDVIFVLNLST